MATKRQGECREVLILKLQDLHDYVSHHERKLDQFDIDLRMAALSRDPVDTIGFVDRLDKALSDLLVAAPAKSLIAEDLAVVRAEINANYNSSPQWDELNRQLNKFDLDKLPVGAGFDSCLTLAMMGVKDRLKKLISMGAPAPDNGRLADELLDILECARTVFQVALTPAFQLRRRWVETLNGERVKPNVRSTGRARRGRPKSEEVIKRDRRMYEAWKAKCYKTYKELGEAFRVSEDLAGKVVRKLERRSKSRPG